MIMKKIFLLLIVISLVTTAFCDEKTNSTSEKPKVKSQNPTLFTILKKKYGSTKTLKANFVQTQFNKMMGSEKKSEGILEIKRPDKFRWDTLKPDATLLVSNGKKIVYFTPPFQTGEKGQVIYKKSADVQSKLAIDLLSGSSNLQKDFKAKKAADGRYELTPIKKNLADINKIELYIEPKTDLVYKLKLQHATENETEIELKNLNLGSQLEDSRFEFVPPPNTEEVK